MKRRDLIAAAAVTAVATPALAAGPGGSGGEEAGGGQMNLVSTGLPVVRDGRIENYVFVSVRLSLAAGANLAAMRLKEPYFRDAMVKAAHRTPFSVEGDATRLNAAAIVRELMRQAPAIAGQGQIASIEVVSQTPRRRSGLSGR